jgi:hypothetical protein
VSLFGRDRELAILTAGIDDALAGRGHLYVLSGEPGVGKTRLLEEVAATAVTRNATVLWGHFWEREGAPPFWPWERLLGALLQQPEAAAVTAADLDLAAQVARLVPVHRFRPDGVPNGLAAAAVDLLPATAAPEPGVPRFTLLDAIATFLRRVAARLPLVVLLDDLHAAGLQALLLLEFVARDLHEAPLLLVATYREAEPRPAGALGERLAELARLSTAIPLRGLDAEATRALVVAVAGRAPSDDLARVLHEKTAGNPFFVDEVVRLLLAENRFDQGSVQRRGLGVPDRVRSAVRARLAPLPVESRDALRAAAVIGQEFDAALLAAVLEMAPDTVFAALDAPVASGFLRPLARGQLRFAHGLIRDTIYDEIPPPRRVALHCRIGAALEDRQRDHPEVALSALAYHFLHGQPEADPGRALYYCRRAGEQALELCAYEHAAAGFEQALELLRRGAPAPDTERGELQLALARSRARAGDPASAMHAVRAAAAEARRLGAPSMLADAALTVRVGVDGATPDGERILLLEEALAALGNEETTRRARLLAGLARELYYTGDAARRDALSRDALSLARRLGDPAALAYTLASRCFAVWGLRPDEERLPLAADLLDLARNMGDRELAIEAHHWRVIDFLALGDIAAVDREVAAATRLADILRQPYYRWWCALWRSTRAALAGEFAEAEQLAVHAHANGSGVQPKNAETSLGGQLFVLAWMRGEMAQLAPAFEAFCAQYQSTYAEVRAGLARALVGAGRLDDARRELEVFAADDFAALCSSVIGQQMSSMAMLTETAVALADTARCSVLYRLMQPFAGRVIVVGIAEGSFGPVDRYLGLLATACGDYAAAERHFAGSLEVSRRLASPPFVAQTQNDLAALLLARGQPGDHPRASTLASAALETAARIGMRGVAEPARTLLSRVARASATVPAAVAATGEVNDFAREGEYWTVRYRGVACRLRHRAGFSHLAALLERPHQEVPALTLAMGIETGAGTAPHAGARAVLDGDAPNDLGEALDPRARADYGERLRDIELEIQAAEQAHDLGQLERLRSEAERLHDSLVAALGLDGRARRAGSPAERARVRVTRALRAAIAGIRAAHGPLGEHLARSVRTGTYCCYAPAEPTTWTVGRRGG